MDESKVTSIKKGRTKAPERDGYAQLKTFMKESGYEPDSFAYDGEIHRFSHEGKKDLGWVIAWENFRVKDGLPYIYGVFGNWREPDSKHEFSSLTMSAADKKIVRERSTNTVNRIKAEKEKARKESRLRAQESYANAAIDGNTSYLEAKGLQGLFGARRKADTLLVPLYDVNGSFRGLQELDPQSEKKKKFTYGTEKKGAFFKIEGEGSLIYLCEGFATGATINLVTRSPVLVAFDKDNLVAVAKAYLDHHPTAEIFVCGDDDKHREAEGKPNGGRIKAIEAALICRTPPLFPIFSQHHGKATTDFNDLYLFEGESAVARALGTLPDVDYAFSYLGHGRGMKEFFFYLPKSRDILSIALSRFKKTELFALAPYEYWKERYPAMTLDGSFDLDSAQNDLIRASVGKGPFDPKKIRYEGVWLDGRRVVVNTGRKLLVDGIPSDSSTVKSDYAYLSGYNAFPCDLTKAATIEDCKPMIRLAGLMNWQDKELAAKIILGWIAVARLGGALEIRPHVWITAPKDAGKTTILSGLAARCLGDENGRLSALAASTEAGIRQALSGRAVPVIMDEFETNDDEHSINTKSGVLNYLRGSWKNVENKQFKGTTGGTALSFEMNSPFLLASIRTSVVNDADLSRISFLELLPHENDEAKRSEIENAVRAIPEGFGDRLFARQVRSVKTIQASFAVLKRVIAQQGKVSRLSEQLGTLLAGYHSLVSDCAITEDEALSYIENAKLQDMATDGIIPDEIQCLQHLLGTRVQLPMHNYADTVESHIATAHGYPERTGTIINGLKSYGLLYNVETKHLKVADGHTQLKQIYSGTPWAKTWGKSLVRLPGASKQSPHRHLADAHAGSYRCTLIDLNLVGDHLALSFSEHS